MRFHLVYSGPLPASGNSSKKGEHVLRIRRELSPQLAELWRTHNSLQVLANVAAIKTTRISWSGEDQMPPRHWATQSPALYKDLIAPIAVGEKNYQPLVRETLSLSCELDILFLRQADPGALVSQGGDLDNRVKTLLDALRMPELQEQQLRPPEEDGLYCLLQSDHLVSRLDIDTDRLLFAQSDKAHEVHLVIGVKINVLRVGPHNMCLL
jgi:hypothetical protein